MQSHSNVTNEIGTDRSRICYCSKSTSVTTASGVGDHDLSTGTVAATRRNKPETLQPLYRQITRWSMAEDPE